MAKLWPWASLLHSSGSLEHLTSAASITQSTRDWKNYTKYLISPELPYKYKGSLLMLQVIALSFPFCPQMQLLAFVLAKFGLLSREAFCFNSEHRLLDFPGEILSEAKEEEISPPKPLGLPTWSSSYACWFSFWNLHVGKISDPRLSLYTRLSKRCPHVPSVPDVLNGPRSKCSPAKMFANASCGHLSTTTVHRGLH